MLGFRPCPYLSAKPAAQRSVKRYLNLQFGYPEFWLPRILVTLHFGYPAF
jgi:hypothetical protein